MRYVATAEPERNRIRIIVREQSECDVIKVKIVSRVVELRAGDTVKHRTPPQNVQIATGTSGTELCHERFTRGQARVALKIGDRVYRVGHPNKMGEVWVDVSERIGQDLYGDDAPGEATILVEGQPAGVVSLATFQGHERRVRELLAELDALLATPPGQSGPEITRVYTAYEQLLELAPDDARLRGVEQRLVEVVYKRRSLMAAENLKRNVEVLKDAKALLGAGAVPGVPMVAQTAVLGAAITGPALVWANTMAGLGLTRYPSLCGPRGSFEWKRLDAGGFPGATTVAMSYLRYAYGDGYAGVLGKLCRRLR
jgi:hypothetical protein